MKYPIKAVFVMVVVLFAACGYALGKSAAKETLREKVQAEWEARVSGKMGVVYDMTVKSFQKEVARDAFLQKPHMQIISFSVKALEISESGKEGRAVVEFKTSQGGFEFAFTKKENWIWEDGDWRLNISPSKTELPVKKNG